MNRLLLEPVRIGRGIHLLHLHQKRETNKSHVTFTKIVITSHTLEEYNKTSSSCVTNTLPYATEVHRPLIRTHPAQSLRLTHNPARKVATVTRYGKFKQR